MSENYKYFNIGLIGSLIFMTGLIGCNDTANSSIEQKTLNESLVPLLKGIDSSGNETDPLMKQETLMAPSGTQVLIIKKEDQRGYWHKVALKDNELWIESEHLNCEEDSPGKICTIK